MQMRPMRCDQLAGSPTHLELMLFFNSLKGFLRRCVLALDAHYSAAQIHSFYRLRNGFIYFSVGIVTVFMAHQHMLPSWQQETVVLAGLLLCALGFFTAMLAYVRLVISRFVQYFKRKD